MEIGVGDVLEMVENNPGLRVEGEVESKVKHDGSRWSVYFYVVDFRAMKI